MFVDQLMVILSEIAVLFPAFLMIFTFRGFFTALIAKWMGDNTAYDDGFLSLNPLVHIDFFGFISMLFFLVLISSFLGFFPAGFLFIMFILLGVRWSIPAPIDENNFKNRSLGIICTTLASSFANFLLALIFIYIANYFPYRFFPEYVFITLIEIFRVTIDLAVFWAILDLLPIPPFNAGRLLQFILPESLHSYISVLEDYSIYVLLALFFLPGLSYLFFNFLFILNVYIKQILFLLVF